jgi:peptide deformylase
MYKAESCGMICKFNILEGKIMAIREVLKMGNPILRQIAQPIDLNQIDNKQIELLVQDMIDTMNVENGIGIAAPQIGESIRLAIFDLKSDNDRYDVEDEADLTVMVNPEYKPLKESETQQFWEGCLSVPGLRGLVERPNKIQLTYYNLDGKKIEKEFEGFLATVIQHELDHLDGILYVDRVEAPHLVFDDQLENWVKFLEDGEGEA